MKVTQIYEKYNIIPNLREHMLRVAGVASMICDNFQSSTDRNSIVSACLLHDMGGMSKIKLELFPDQLKGRGRKYWQNVQYEFIQKYGPKEHDALYKVIAELGVEEKVNNLIKGFGFGNIPKTYESKDMLIKICEYSDMRVSPEGVVQLQQRLNEAMARYLTKQKGIYTKEQFENNIPLMEEIEKQIFAHCKIKPDEITDEKIRHLIKGLMDFEIKTGL